MPKCGGQWGHGGLEGDGAFVLLRGRGICVFVGKVG